MQNDSLLVQGGTAQLIHDSCSITQAGCLQVRLQQLAWFCGPLPESTDPRPTSGTSKSTVFLLMLRASWLSTAIMVCLLRQLRHSLRRGLLRVWVACFLDEHKRQLGVHGSICAALPSHQVVQILPQQLSR